jgi:uncharacterized protein (TIGR00251 family)
MCSPLSEADEGVRLRVRAVPKAGRNEVAGVRNGRLLVRVTAAPEDGKANTAIVKLLSKTWSLPASAIELTAGATSRDKTFLLRGVSAADIPL